MKINITKTTLLEGIQVISTGSASRTTMPILHNFLIETQGNKIKLVRTDLEMATIHYIPAEIEEEGSLTIPLKEFTEIVKNLPDDKEINLSTGENNKFHIKSGKSKFWIIGMPKEDYPEIPEIQKTGRIELSPVVLQNMIDKTIFSVSTSAERYLLNGLLWKNSPEGFEIVATDGGRLAIALHEALPGTDEFKIIIPAKILNEIVRFISLVKPEKEDLVSIYVNSTQNANQVSFEIKETTFISRLIDGNFPNYKQVIPSKKNISFEIFTKELLASTRRAALCSNEFGCTVKFHIENNLITISSNSQNKDFMEEIPTQYTQEPFDCAFKPQFIIDVLKNVGSEKVNFSFVNSSQPALIEPVGDDSLKYVIMPVRI